jgi:hypothetical protein
VPTNRRCPRALSTSRFWENGISRVSEIECAAAKAADAAHMKTGQATGGLAVVASTTAERRLPRGVRAPAIRPRSSRSSSSTGSRRTASAGCPRPAHRAALAPRAGSAARLYFRSKSVDVRERRTKGSALVLSEQRA